MGKPELVRFEIEGAEIAVRLAGDRGTPALLLMHFLVGLSLGLDRHQLGLQGIAFGSSRFLRRGLKT